MSTISASTTSTTAYKVTADTTGTLVLQTGASPTTAVTISSAQIVSFANSPVSYGGGAVSSNTAYGASALAANTTGLNNYASGYQALTLNTTGSGNTAIGATALASNISGSSNTAVGSGAGASQTTGAGTFVGSSAGANNTTGANNTFIGYICGRGDTTNKITGQANTGVGSWHDGFLEGPFAYLNTGSYNSALGNAALRAVSSGSYNTAIGYAALQANTTANNNTAVGYQAGYANSTGTGLTLLGYGAGYSMTGNYNVAVGVNAGQFVSSGTYNTLLGTAAGQSITTGSKNTIIGSYGGNQSGLDIRTASNYIVLSDGDGNPRQYFDSNGQVTLSAASGTGVGASIQAISGGTTGWKIGDYGAITGGASNTSFACRNSGGGGVYISGASGTSWTAVSDERVKENLETISDAANKVSTLRAVIGNYKWDEEKVRRPFLIAQDVQKVLPEAVTKQNDEFETLGVSYTDVIPLLVAAIKELNAKVEAQAVQIAAQAAEIATLKGQA